MTSVGTNAVYTSESGIFTITLPSNSAIELDVFRATSEDYVNQLRWRRDLPDGLNILLLRLFELGAITACKITYRTRLELLLRQYDAAGHLLLSGKRVEQFVAAFIDITDVPLDTVWRSSGSRAANGDGIGTPNWTGLLNALATVARGVAEGLQVAAAVDILTRNN